MEPPRTLYHLICDGGNNTSEAPAILSPGKEFLSYRELSRHLQSSVLKLTRMGIRPGNRVAVVLPNGPDMATAFLAVSSVCTCAPLNPAFQVDEFKFSMEDMRVNALITIPGSNAPACKAAADLGIPVITLEPDAQVAGIFHLTSDLPGNDAITEPILADPNEAALVLHTSGTTSRPKTVPLCHANIFRVAAVISETYVLTPADRCLNMMPLFHIHGLVGLLAASLVSGSSVICTPGFLSEQVMSWLSELAPTWYSAVPTIHQAVLEQAQLQAEIAKRVHLRFIRSSSAPLAPKVAQDLEKVFNAPVLEAYGMTEATHQIASNPLPPRSHKFGSVGLATGTTRISIRDEQGKILPPSTTGEICVGGENVITEYENNPAANATSFIDGWLRTGDRGYLDEDGFLFIHGRVKEIINRGGEKISPREIDEVLLRHPAVKQAVAFAVPHPSLGEDVAAAIVLRDGQTVTAKQLQQIAAASLASFKVPRQIVFVREIPKGATGKIQRIGLAKKLKAELEAFTAREAAGKSMPNSPLEAEVLSIWQRVLNNRQIGVSDDFLALGGNSIQAARVLLLVNERYGMNLQISDIFFTSTVAAMANLVQIKRDQDLGNE